MEITPGEAVRLSLTAELIAAGDFEKAEAFSDSLRGFCGGISREMLRLKTYSSANEDAEDEYVRIANAHLKWAENRRDRVRRLL